MHSPLLFRHTNNIARAEEIREDRAQVRLGSLPKEGSGRDISTKNPKITQPLSGPTVKAKQKTNNVFHTRVVSQSVAFLEQSPSSDLGV
jgi:hypothetical protein